MPPPADPITWISLMNGAVPNTVNAELAFFDRLEQYNTDYFSGDVSLGVTEVAEKASAKII